MPNFLRQATIQVPVSATSASAEFAIPAELQGIPNLTFFFVNPNEFDVRLEGTPKNATFTSVTASTGWLVYARERTPVYGSKMPVKLSAMAVNTRSNPLIPGTDYSGAYIELVYGRGGNRG